MKQLALGFLVICGLAAFTTSCTDPERCQLGTAGCLCDEGVCQGDLTCDDGRCLEPGCEPGSDDCLCDDGACDAGLVCVTSENLCVPEGETVCEDSCYALWHGDGDCDDGGPGFMFTSCNLGTDCTDCGPRRNPCVDPMYPKYCPQTPAVGVEQCWTPPTDCDSITSCAGDPTLRACVEGFRYDCAAGGCVPNVCVDFPDRPVFCDFDPTCATSTSDFCCFPPNSDCRTATVCGGEPGACIGRTAPGAIRTVLQCAATGSEFSCVVPVPVP